MRSQLAAAALATSLLFALAPRAAHACGSGYGNAGGTIALLSLGVVGLAVGDLSYGIADGVLAARDSHPGVGYGVGEMFLAVPTVALGALLLSIPSGSNSGTFEPAYYVFAGGVTAIGVLMGVHAVWTFATQPETTPRQHVGLQIRNASDLQRAAAFAEAPPAPRMPGYQLTVAPTMLTMRDHSGDKVAPGVGALLRF